MRIRWAPRPPRFTLSTLLLLTLVAAVAVAWWRDHRRLTADIKRLVQPPNHWGTIEVTGAPDTSGYGDIPTAWASQTPDGQKEWLVLEYDRAVNLKQVLIHETYNPGAVTKVTAFDGRNREHVIWEGTDPTPVGNQGGVSRIPVRRAIKTSRIKVYIDSPKVLGWNEIDAVGIRDRWGRVQWATAAYASSSFGDNPLPPMGTWARVLR